MDFKAKYNQTNFINFFSVNLLPEDFTPETEVLSLDFKSNYFNQVTYLGGCPSLDLSVYEIRHSSEKDARVGLSRDAFKLISRFSTNNALILFVPDDPLNFRLSLVTIEPKLDDKGVKVLKEYSNPRRYSFILGDDAKIHTPEQYLIGLGRITDNADLKKRFSVEVVNKEFYGRIAEMFSRLVGGKRKKGSKTVDFERSLALPSVSPENDQKYKEFAVRLIGRTVFCWFLKKKKSGNGIPLIDDDVLSAHQADYTSNFYHSRVEPLFFEILNTPLEKRKPEYQKKPFSNIPFLNGGLFEPHSDDYFLNGQPNYALKIPDQWWKDFLDILEIYNFTIDENTSIDIDLSVDPEMLGRIFENLLAEINPETGETARKATGSYYTPRPIVEYMVDQSLKQYLITKTGIDEAKFDTLLDYSNESSGLTTEEEKRVIEALNSIKVLDPACGSGAFPMGMLQKMLLILQKVDHEANNSLESILDDVKDPIKRELFKRKLESAKFFEDKNFDDYLRKLKVIQRSIYGVDIQPIATDISKLRFFLSLIVDEVVQDDQTNRGIEPLPNLEFKFVCANSLIKPPKNEAIETYAKNAIENLETLTTKYIISIGDEKNIIRGRIKESINEIVAANEKVVNQWLDKIIKHKNSASKAKIAQMNKQQEKYINDLNIWSTYKNIFKNEPISFFDVKFMFPQVKGGFDIIIGNPPYIKEYTLKSAFDGLRDSDYYIGKMDLWYFFACIGIDMLKEETGVLCYIATNNWTTSFGARKLRNKVVNDTRIVKLLDFNNFKIFETADIQTMVMIFEKNRKDNSYQLEFRKLNNDAPSFNDVIDLLDGTPKNNIIINPLLIRKNFEDRYLLFTPYKEEVLLNKIINRENFRLLENGDKSLDILPELGQGIVAPQDTLNQSGKDRLGDDFEVGQGIFFITDSENELYNWAEKETGLIKPLYTSKQLKRYFAEKNNSRFVIYTDSRFKNSNLKIKKPDINISDFPNIKRHLDKFIRIISSSNRPYGLHRSREQRLFEGEKIMALRKCSERPIFTFTDFPCYVSQSYNVIKTSRVDNRYLTGLLNSKLIAFWLRYKGKMQGSNYQIDNEPLSQIPIYVPKDASNLSQIVSEIIEIKQEDIDADISYLETRIDLMVYKLYELTYDEVQVVDPNIERIISRENYERMGVEELGEYSVPV